MNNLATLPPGIQQHIGSLERRLHRLIAVRRGGLLLAALASAFVAVFCADLILGLPSLWLRILFAGLLGAFAASGVFGILLPSCRRIQPQTLAALIERKHPELAERLTSVVALGANRQGGSEALIALLLAEAETGAQHVDAAHIVNAWPAKRSALFGSVCLLAAILPAFLFVEYAVFSERLLLSWVRPLNDYAMHVTPSSGAFAIGRPLTITVALQAHSRRLQLPKSCNLVYRAGEGEWQTAEMTPDANQRYACVIPGPAADITFHVEAAVSVSEVHELKAVEPVAVLAAKSTAFVKPPAYSQAAVEKIAFNNSSARQAVFEFGQVAFEVYFSRRPLQATVHLKKENTNEEWRVPMTIKSGEASAQVTLPMLPPGTYAVNFELAAEHGIATFAPFGVINVGKDAAPALHVNAGAMSAQSETVAPSDDTINLKIAARDDLGIGAVQLEYQVNDDPAKSLLIADVAGRRTFDSDYRFRLRGQVKSGDRLRYRIKAADTRSVARETLVDVSGRKVPAVELTPQATWWPTPTTGDGWQAVKILDAAESLAKQNILSDRDKISKWIESIRTRTVLEKNHLDKFRRDSFHQPITGVLQEKQLAALREENRDVHVELMLFAHQTGEHELLAALSSLAADIAAKEIDQAGAALARVQDKRGEADARDRQVVEADNALNAALNRIGELARRNEQLAEYRLDQMKLDRLADEQEVLAGRAAELAKLDPANSPEAATELARIRAEQEKIAAELDRLTKQSQLFQQALRQALAEQARQLGQQAQQLAQEQSKLAQAMADNFKQQMSREVAELATKQTMLAKKVGVLHDDSQGTAREKSAAELDASLSQNAASALGAGDLQLAAQEQLASENDLDRFAAELSVAELLVWNPRQLAVKVAQQQLAIRKSLEKLGADLAQLSPQETVRRLAEVTAEQRELAVGLLKLGERKSKGTQGFASAAKLAAEAADQLQRADTVAAHGQMEQAKTILDGLAAGLPSASEQRTYLSEELAQLRTSQERIAEKTAAAIKTNAANLKETLAALAGEQSAALKRLTELPLAAAHAPLRDRLAMALGGVLKDLQQARTEKVAQTAAQIPAAVDQFKGILLGLVQIAGAEPPKTAAAKHAAQACTLAAEQHALRIEVEKLLGGSAPAATPEDIARRQAELAEQKKLTAKAGKLTGDLIELDKMGGKSDAIQFAQQAEEAMKKAGAGEGKSSEEAKKAADMLAKSAEKTEELAKEMSQPDDKSPFDFKRADMAKTGEALMAGKDKTELARRELDKKEGQLAPKAMQQAANAMNQAAKQAAQQLAQMQRQQGPAPANSNTLNPGLGSNSPSAKLTPEALKEFTARQWGELPGSLRTQIVQDLRARYGEEYARLVQQYFERLAEAQ